MKLLIEVHRLSSELTGLKSIDAMKISNQQSAISIRGLPPASAVRFTLPGLRTLSSSATLNLAQNDQYHSG
jgi:hypothetical protein